MKQPLGDEAVFGKGSGPAEDKLTLAADTTLIEAATGKLTRPNAARRLPLMASALLLAGIIAVVWALHRPEQSTVSLPV